MPTIKSKTEKRERRHRRVRARIFGTASCPRLSIFRSNRFIYAQLIDDEAGRTLAEANDSKIKPSKKSDKGFAKVDRSVSVGQELAKKAKALGLIKVVFDRGGYQYTGRVKAIAEGGGIAGVS